MSTNTEPTVTRTRTIQRSPKILQNGHSTRPKLFLLPPPRRSQWPFRSEQWREHARQTGQMGAHTWSMVMGGMERNGAIHYVCVGHTNAKITSGSGLRECTHGAKPAEVVAVREDGATCPRQRRLIKFDTCADRRGTQQRAQHTANWGLSINDIHIDEGGGWPLQQKV